jgi:hypothetical protein
VACQTVLNEDMSSFQVCFQGLATTMHPRKTITSSVASHAAFNIFVASGRPYRPRPTGGNTPAGKDGRPSYRKKGLGKFTPPRQPALEELVIQVKDKLEKLPGGLLLRKPPKGEFLPQEFFELGASLPGHMSRPHPTLFRGTVPANGGRPPDSLQRAPPLTVGRGSLTAPT